MPYLDHFDYDIFISHSWSGNQNEGLLDRKFVGELKEELQGELIARLRGRPVSIFLDAESPRNGDTEKLFRTRIQGSAIILAIVTPAFCEEQSFCRKELDWFWNECRPISTSYIDTDKRLFKIVRRPVDKKTEPEQVIFHSPYTFYEGAPAEDNLLDYDLLSMTAIDSLPQSRISSEYRKLVPALAGFLNRCKQTQSNFPIRTIFLAESSCPEVGQVVRALDKHEVISCPESSGISEAAFVAKTTEMLATSDYSIHLIDTSAPLMRPSGWRRSVVENQLLCAHAMKNPNFCAHVWCDCERTIKDPLLEKLMHRTQHKLMNTGHIEFYPQGIQYFTSNLPEMLKRDPRKDKVPAAALSGKRVSVKGKRLFVQCMMGDLDKLEPAFQIMDSIGLAVQIPLFDATADDQETFQKRFLTTTDGTLIYFGSGGGAWTFKLCDKAVEVYGAALDMKKRFVGIDPPNENWRKRFNHPGFKIIPFPTDPGQLSEQVLRNMFR